MNLNHVHGEVCSVQHYVIQFAALHWFSLDTLVSFTNTTDRYDITEILWKVAFNTMTLNLIHNPLNVTSKTLRSMYTFFPCFILIVASKIITKFIRNTRINNLKSWYGRFFLFHWYYSTVDWLNNHSHGGTRIKIDSLGTINWENTITHVKSKMAAIFFKMAAIPGNHSCFY